MLMESIQLLVLGMGTVFCILLLLIAGLSIMSSLIAKPPEVLGEEASQSSTSINTGVVAAIQAAVHSYRSAQNR
jgi:sodium pump decarboxylase gamma subunit